MATNGSDPATKADLAKPRDDFKEAFAKLRDDFVEQLRETEAKLLTAFYAIAESNEKRLLQAEASDAILISRVASIETRLTDVEKRLNMPPSQ